MNIRELLEQHGVRVWEPGESHHVTSNFIGVDCPFCSPGSGRVRMGFHVNKLFCVCWACGPHNRVEAMSLLTGMSKHDAWSAFGGIDFDRYDGLPPVGRLVMPEHRYPGLLQQHRKYLRERGFTNLTDLINMWNLECFHLLAPPGLAWRIFIPFYYRGEVVSWTTRAITDAAAVKYKNAPTACEKLPASSLLYGEDYVGNSVIVHEGPLDVWRTGPGAVATCGASFSRAQVARLAKYPKRIVCFDADRAGRERARALCGALSPFEGETLNVVLDAEDAGSASEAELKKLRRLL